MNMVYDMMKDGLFNSGFLVGGGFFDVEIELLFDFFVMFYLVFDVDVME